MSPPRGPRLRPRRPGPLSFLGATLLLCLGGACGPDVPPGLRPDDVLRAELGLTDDDEVHRIEITGVEQESVTPAEAVLDREAWVEFVSADWGVHEVRFELDSLNGESEAFLRTTDQVASPPLLERDARFVVSFHTAPPGRYPFIVEGNGMPARGVVVVQPRR